MDYYACVEKGIVHFEKGEYGKAVRCFNMATGLAPWIDIAWIWKGLSYRHLNMLDTAIFSYNKAIEANTESYLAYNNMGYALNEIGMHEEAYECFLKVTDIMPDDMLGWRNLGFTLFQMERYDEALSCFEKAITSSTEDSAAALHVFRGNALGKLGRTEEALLSYDDSISVDCRDLTALNNKGILLEKMERYDEAAGCFEKILEIIPDDIFTIKKIEELNLKIKSTSSWATRDHAR